MRRLLPLLLCLASLTACSAPSASSVPTPPPDTPAQLAHVEGVNAYHDMDIRRAITYLHEALHLNRDNAIARELFWKANLLVGCGGPIPSCAALSGDDPWADAGSNPEAQLRRTRQLLKTEEHMDTCANLLLESIARNSASACGS